MNLDLSLLDAVKTFKCTGLLLPVYEDERPLKGSIAEIDWIFHGRFTQAYRSKTLSGRIGEHTYHPIHWNSHPFHFFLVGCGTTRDANSRRASRKLFTEGLIAAKGLHVQDWTVRSSDWDIPEEMKAEVWILN